METVRCYFDPMCPWAYQTSLWLRRVGVAVDWRFFSLEEVNLVPGKKHPWERDWAYGWSQMRIAALLRRSGLVDQWYAAVGAAFFEQGLPTFTYDGAVSVVTSMGLPASVVRSALDDPSTSTEVSDDHFGLVASGGFGVPTLVFEDGTSLYGPVVLEAPSGPSAIRLWELVQRWREFPDLFELRRPKAPSDLARIGVSFDTYLRARAWRTIENPAP